MTLDQAWKGVMIEYTEQDFPGSKPYQRQVPGWECRNCGQKYGTSGLPPLHCSGCEQMYERNEAENAAVEAHALEGR